MIFDEDLLPGYAWVFPVGEGGRTSGSACCAIATRRNGRTMAAQWRDVTSHPAVRRALGPRAQPDGAHRAWPIPSAYDPRRLARGRVLYVGDAANVVDPMTGEGIAQALETGALASRAIATSPMHPDQVMARYRDVVDRTLGADLRFARMLQQILRSPVGARTAIRAASLTPWTRRNFARWMFEDYPRAIMTPRRWRRGLFTGTGAYAASCTAATTPVPRLALMAVTNHWLNTPHWSTEIPLDTPHPRLAAFAEHGYVALRDFPDDIPEAEYLSLEYMEWKSGGDTNFAPMATADGELDCRGFWKPGEERPDKGGRFTSNAPLCPTLVREVESVGADFGAQ